MPRRSRPSRTTPSERRRDVHPGPADPARVTARRLWIRGSKIQKLPKSQMAGSSVLMGVTGIPAAAQQTPGRAAAHRRPGGRWPTSSSPWISLQ
jgi:hypothetical protein